MSKEEAEVGRKDWVKNAYEKAFRMWKEHGERNHILMTDEQEKVKLAQVEAFRREAQRDPGLGSRRREIPKVVLEGIEAERFLDLYQRYRVLTNIAHFYMRSRIGSQDEVIDARKLFFEADEPQNRPNREGRLKKYEQALAIWVKLLQKDPAMREDDFTREEAYEWELRYLALFQDLPDRGQILKKVLVVQDLAGLMAASPRPPLNGCSRWESGRACSWCRRLSSMGPSISRMKTRLLTSP